MEKSKWSKQPMTMEEANKIRPQAEKNASVRISKRPILRWMKRDHDFLISRRDNLQAVQKRIVQKLGEQFAAEGPRPGVFIHGMGAAIQCSVDLAQAIVESSGGRLKTSATTSTVAAVDNILDGVFEEAKAEVTSEGKVIVKGTELNERSSVRMVSAIHIHIFLAKP